MADSRMIRNQYDYLRRLDVDELERLLQLAVNPQCDEEDSDYVDALLEVILEKEQEEDTGRLSDVDEKWQEFQRHYNTEESKDQHMHYTEETDTPDQTQAATSNVTTFPKRRLRRTLMLAAVIALLVSIMLVPVMGQKNVIQLFAQWTEDQFSFLSEKTLNVDNVPEEYRALVLTLERRGIEKICIPKYIPSGFLISESIQSISPKTGYITFSIEFQNQTDYIVFQLEQIDGNNSALKEKDSTDIEIYEAGTVEHYILQNNENITVAWHTDDLSYFLTSSIPIAEIKMIIDSMYER